MKPLLILFTWIALAAAAPIADGPIRLCPGSTPSAACRPVALDTVRLDAPETVLVETVTVAPGALPLARPLAVRVIALASSELRWNGVVIGRNGAPGPDVASEAPGLFVASFTIPSALVRPGDNLLSVRFSAHRLFLPVRTPIHAIEIAPYETPSLPGLSDYLPALLALGALIAAFAYFAMAAALERSERDARLLAGIALTAATQLCVEVSRAFIAYTYPWHLARVTAIASLAALTAILIAAYAARRWAPARRRLATLLTLFAALASLVLMPWYDLKALGAILAGAAALGGCAVAGLRARRPRAGFALAVSAALATLMAWQLTAFLDEGYYLILAAALVALIAEQVTSLRRLRAERDTEHARALALAERLGRAERAGEPILALKDGTRSHRVAEGDIVAIRAADDYCDVLLVDGRALLVTMTLGAVLETLPPRFARVHKSHAVNRAHVAAAVPRAGGGRLLKLSDGSEVPVGRAYAPAVAGWLEGPKPSPSGG